MTEAVRAFLEALECPIEGNDLDRTPQRVARAWAEDLISGYELEPQSLLTWSAAPAEAGPVIVRDISFTSVCAHHLLPFFGRAGIVYLPDERLAGLSKLGRVVDAWARRLQTQEHLTSAICDTLAACLLPRGVAVRLEAEHTCMTHRGVRKEQSRMITLATRGVYREDSNARAEALSMLDGAPADFR